MHKKAISRRKWKSFVRKAIVFLFLAFLGCLVGSVVWFPHFFVKNPLINPLGSTFSSTINPANTEIVVTSVEHLCQTYSISCDSVSIASDSSVLIFLKDNGMVILDSKKNLEKQVASLQLAITNLTIEGKRFRTLDFRFDRPVITF